MTPQEKVEFAKLPSLQLDDIEQVEYIHTIAEGWAYPLKRFMNEQELIESMNMNTVTCDEGKRHILSVPITQYLTKEQKSELEGHPRIVLKSSDEVLAVVEQPEFFDNRKEEICAKTFGTKSIKHPKIQRIYEQGDYLLSGESMRFTQVPVYNDGLDKYRLNPA